MRFLRSYSYTISSCPCTKLAPPVVPLEFWRRLVGGLSEVQPHKEQVLEVVRDICPV
jgi:hypothetical protein